MALMKFNRSKVQYGRKIEQPSEELIRNTLALHNASLEDAIKYGGELTRAALDAMDLTFSKKYIVVDTKIHMLMPGMSPAIPGWHTDGVPRGSQLDPQFKGRPDIKAQETLDSPIFHLLVTGDSLHLSKYLTKGKVLRVDKFYCDREQVVVYLKSVPGKIHFEVGFYGHELRKIEEVK